MTFRWQAKNSILVDSMQFLGIYALINFKQGRKKLFQDPQLFIETGRWKQPEQLNPEKIEMVPVTLSPTLETGNNYWVQELLRIVLQQGVRPKPLKF